MELISSEIYKKIDDQLREMTKGWSSGVNCGRGYDIATGEEIGGAFYHNGCHSFINQCFNSMGCKGTKSHAAWAVDFSHPGAKNFVVTSCYKRRACTKEAADALLLWMAKESPFKDYILNRDDEESLFKGGVMILCGPSGANVAEAMWICKVLRYITESGTSIDVWYDLVEEGIDPIFALFPATFFNKKDSLYIHKYEETHSSVVYGISPKDVGNTLVKGAVFRGAERTSEVFGKFTTSGYNTTYSFFQGWAKSATVSDGWGGTVKKKGLDREGLVTKAREWYASFGGEVKDTAAKPTKTTVFLEEGM